ncbi:allophanate hydrolase subunit 1 [Nocardioides marmotae]|uniref:5-oxoprolinase subunit B family protein n=1 Tax=Nocardioides marmotae TaxID=2663857 RepID=UPI002934908A|nr:allophanate hydrolase subunit 1 [Nocardioides marmotae]
MSVRARPFGPSAVLVEVDGPAEALALAAWVRTEGLPVVEVVPAAATVLLDGTDPAVVLDALAGWTPEAAAPAGGLVEVPVVYDGEDLAYVAERWGVDVDEAVERHAATAFVSAFCGFAPGFAYLTGLPDELAVPRLDSPRPRVPAGSVALAGTWCGVYPTASPGGWRILGRTDVALWDPDRPTPALLAPGTRVRFVRA